MRSWWFGWSWWSVGWFGSNTRTWTRPAAGTLLEHSPFFDTAQYYNEDYLPKEQCCSTGHCDWYYEVRPRTWCYRVSWFRICKLKQTHFCASRYPYDIVHRYNVCKWLSWRLTFSSLLLCRLPALAEATYRDHFCRLASSCVGVTKKFCHIFL